MFTDKQCEKCQYEHHRSWVKAHPEEMKAHYRKNYEKNVKGNPERMAKVRTRNKAWGKANRDGRREYERLWRADNPEKANEKARRWKQANPESNRASSRRRRANEAVVVSDLTDAQWQAILDFHSSPEGTRCAYCFGVCEKVTQDHVVPISEGGGHTAANVIPACKPCNSSQGAKEVALWL